MGAIQQFSDLIQVEIRMRTWLNCNMSDKDNIFSKRMLAVADTQLTLHLIPLSRHKYSFNKRICMHMRLSNHSLLTNAH